MIMAISEDEFREIKTIKRIRSNISEFDSTNRIKLLTMAMIQELNETGNDIAVEAAIDMLKERI